MPWIAPDFNGNEMIRSYIARYYKLPGEFESFVYLSQLMQAEGVRFAIETHRKNMPHCMGSLYWQINDYWPAISWAGVDYFGRWKALHYFAKKAFQPVCPVIYREGNNINVAVVSDLPDSFDITIEATLYDFDGSVLWENKKDTLLAANASHIYMSMPEKELLSAGPASSSVLHVIVRSEEKTFSENNFYFTDCKELNLMNPGIQRVITKINENEFEIELSSQSLAKNVALSTSITEGFFSDNFFDLIPGKSYKIKFTGAANDLDEELEVMSVNECR
jgi:beta-mannosidase